jgi:DNA-binding beta-propeller fold protein YncE
MKMKFASGFALSLLSLSLNAQTVPLTAGDPIPVAGSGGYDFIRVDTAGNRLLLGHEGNKSFDVFDLDARQLLKVVPTSTSQDGATDVKGSAYYVSGNDPGHMVIVDAETLAIKGEVPLPAACDLIGFDPETGLVHLCNDTAAEQWVIDPAAKKIVATIHFDGSGLEDLAFDFKNRKLYQAVKGTNAIAEVDLADNKVLATWPLAPDKGPHGIALVPDSNGLLVACASKLVLMDRTNGKILATAPIGGRVDEMTYDPGLHTAYCASRQGKISVVAVDADKLTAMGDVPDAEKTGDIAVDPATHIVWIGYAKGGKCFVQPFTPAKK